MPTNRGFSSIELLIVSVVVGILSLSIASMIANLSVSIASAEMRVEAANVIGEIQMSLANPALCTAHFKQDASDPYSIVPTEHTKKQALSLGGLATEKVDFLKISDGQNPIVQTGQPLNGLKSLKIDSMTIKNIVPNGGSLLGRVYLQFMPVNDIKVVGGGFRERWFPITLKVDGAGQITECQASLSSGSGAAPGGPEEVCNALGLPFNSSTQKCDLSSLKNVAGGCPLGQIVTGISAMGVVCAEPTFEAPTPAGACKVNGTLMGNKKMTSISASAGVPGGCNYQYTIKRKDGVASVVTSSSTGSNCPDPYAMINK